MMFKSRNISATFSYNRDLLRSVKSTVTQAMILCHLLAYLPLHVGAFVSIQPFSLGAKTVGITTAIGSSEQRLSEVEQLLQKAKKLRAEAEQQEQEIHTELIAKKAKEDVHLDGLIGYIFSGYDVVEQLRKKKLSMSTLEQIIDRLEERHVVAMGQERVEAINIHHEGEPSGEGLIQFSRVTSERDDNHAVYIGALIECLIESVSVLDKDFSKKKGGISNLWKSTTRAESNHWGGGYGARDLRQRLREKRRGRDQQFLERQEEFNEAQRIHKKYPANDFLKAPLKPKDDHGFKSEL